MLKNILLYLSAVTLSGCANLSPIAITLTDLGTASKSEHSMNGLTVMRTVNITSLGPNEVIGSMSIDPDPSYLNIPNFMATTDYPDSLSFRLSPDCSRIVETKFAPQVTAADVVTVRDSIKELVELVSNKVALEIKQVILFNISQNLADKTRDPKEILRLLQTQYPADKLSNESEINDTLKNVNAELEVAQQKIKEKREALKATLDVPGIVVTRWTQERKKKGMFDAFKGFIFQGSSSSQQEGFLVLGNPRVTSLMLGDDAMAEVQKGDGDCGKEGCLKIKTLFTAKRTYVTYYQLSAEHIAWGEVRSGVSNKSIQADISKIASTLHPALKGANFATILKDLEIKAALETSRAYDYGNSGLLSGGNTRTFPMRFSDTKNYVRALAAEQGRSQRYRSIYNARGTLEQVIARKLGSKVSTDEKGKVKPDAKLKLARDCAKSYPPINFEQDELGSVNTQ